MLNAIVVSIRFIVLIFGGQEQVALENVALRQQLSVFKREVQRPKLKDRDRLFWIGLRMIWQDWKSALVIVRPETVISWHRKRFRRYWWKLSQHKQPGRPRTRAEIRQLIHDMATANPTWGALRVHGELKKLGFRISERTVSRLMPKKMKAIADMDDVPSKSRRPNGLGRLLHSFDYTAPRVVRIMMSTDLW
jgi:putative transposase